MLVRHNSGSDDQFGWLLKDVPKSTRILDSAEDDPLFIFKRTIDNNGVDTKKITKKNHIDCPKTPSPYRQCNKMMKTIAVLSSTWPSPRLSHTIELDDNEEDEHRYQFFKVATMLDNRLEDISFQTTDMQERTKTLKQAYEELDGTASQLLTDMRHFVSELQDVRHMEDLIRLLDGKPEKISRQKWPFTMAHSSPFSDLNLIV